VCSSDLELRAKAGQVDDAASHIAAMRQEYALVHAAIDTLAI
jgi:hypothetical protein